MGWSLICTSSPGSWTHSHYLLTPVDTLDFTIPGVNGLPHPFTSWYTYGCLASRGITVASPTDGTWARANSQPKMICVDPEETGLLRGKLWAHSHPGQWPAVLTPVPFCIHPKPWYWSTCLNFWAKANTGCIMFGRTNAAYKHAESWLWVLWKSWFKISSISHNNSS